MGRTIKIEVITTLVISHISTLQPCLTFSSGNIPSGLLSIITWIILEKESRSKKLLNTMHFAQVLRRRQNFVRHHTFLGKDSAAPAAACGVGQIQNVPKLGFYPTADMGAPFQKSPTGSKPSFQTVCLPSHCLELHDTSLGERSRLNEFRKNA